MQPNQQRDDADDDQVNFYVGYPLGANYGHRTQKPFVAVTVQSKEFFVQMSPDDARALAHNLLECAEAADSDAFLMSFMKRKIGIDQKSLAGILLQFRNWRDKQRATNPRDTSGDR